MNYKNNFFHVENISTEKLSKKFKTPLYCYSYSRIKNNITNFKKHFKRINPLICFSVKSNSNVKILKEIKNFGCGADVVSKGEIIKAIKAGIKTKNICFCRYFYMTFMGRVKTSTQYTNSFFFQFISLPALFQEARIYMIPIDLILQAL